ncbi:annexin-B12-like isoform X2 [Actinia tenebrosa]|uniref:Annexin n=1 Tax=Actinia tenebrosa TaxID=6105 RepID=A0A6P8HJJ3_ACTTE|nr:annexin-B12-like isoform X2 [Actinia tenebrosa]
MSYGPPWNYGMPQPGAPPFPMQQGGAPPPLGFDHVLSSPSGPAGVGGMPMPMAQPSMPYQAMPTQSGPGMPLPGAMSYPTPGYGPAPPASPAPMGHYPNQNLTFGTTYYHEETSYSTQSTVASAPPLQTMASSVLCSSKPSSRGRPSVTAYSPFDGKKDAEVLRKAMKGLGCDNKAITYLLCSRTNAQRQRISIEYKTIYGRDLMKDLKSELGGHFEDTVIALMTPPEEYDATLIRKALKGLGTNEEILIEILSTRTNNELVAIKNAYQRLFERDMEKDIAGDTSGHFKKFLISLAQAYREETDQVDIHKARASAEALYKAGEGRWGTDEAKFNSVLASKSFPQLRAVFDEYSKICKYDIEESIRREMSGDLKDGMVSIVQVVRNAPGFFAQKLYKSMKGLGTDDKALIRVVVTRSEIDILDIKDEFAKQYGQSLAQFIADDTKGNYKRILLQLIGESA